MFVSGDGKAMESQSVISARLIKGERGIDEERRTRARKLGRRSPALLTSPRFVSPSSQLNEKKEGKNGEKRWPGCSRRGKDER